MITRVVATLAALGLLASEPALACGKERWPVKIAAAETVPKVETLAAPWGFAETTITDLAAIPAPPNPKRYEAERFLPTEATVFSLEGTLVLIKHEADGDYHLVLRDAAGATMIVEAPDPACAKGSVALGQIEAVRAAIDKYFAGPVTTRRDGLTVPLRVSGLGFFDPLHGQEGVAPNGIELHPLLDIQFR